MSRERRWEREREGEGGGEREEKGVKEHERGEHKLLEF